ncbi:uncharacterized protein LOC121799641 isoform X2 [Salvia splendens]|uniref:uncharacterized protein LOC121799641 isoform X2 n=1 Tax=Salvia splendens TaxID=180675 RepID=UPI001C26599D|nr:uncharacterized protein LOC121799641 isoform X2 [Salvia splendens]
MALILSASFSMPHCHRQTQFQASYSRRLTGGRLSNSLTSQAVCVTATVKKHVSGKYCGEGMISSTGRHSREWVDIGGACCCVHVQISGFWMGPDAEDGWGFVEATVYMWREVGSSPRLQLEYCEHVKLEGV